MRYLKQFEAKQPTKEVKNYEPEFRKLTADIKSSIGVTREDIDYLISNLVDDYDLVEVKNCDPEMQFYCNSEGVIKEKPRLDGVTNLEPNTYPHISETNKKFSNPLAYQFSLSLIKDAIQKPKGNLYFAYKTIIEHPSYTDDNATSVVYINDLDIDAIVAEIQRIEKSIKKLGGEFLYDIFEGYIVLVCYWQVDKSKFISETRPKWYYEIEPVELRDELYDFALNTGLSSNRVKELCEIIKKKA